MWSIVVFNIWKQVLQNTNGSYPVDEEGLCEFDHLQCDQQADRDQVVVKDDERQQVICKIGRDVTCM